MSLEWLYTFDELRAYSLATRQGKERFETLTEHLPDLLKVAEVKTLEGQRVLCLMAGSCIEGISLAKLYKAKVTCIDLQKRLLAIGAREARRLRLNIRTVTGDVKELARLVSGTFDLVTIMGSPLPHLSIHDFDRVIEGVKKIIASNGTFLVEQSDMIFRIIPQYRDAFVANLNPPVINLHRSFNPREGYFERLYYSRAKQQVAKMYLWSPWIIQYMLGKNGFSKVKVKPYADPFNMTQTHLFTAQK